MDSSSGINKPNSNFFNSQILPRWNNASSIPGDVFYGVSDLIKGTFFQATGLLTLGQVDRLKDSDHRMMKGSRVLAKVFSHALGTINPSARGACHKSWGNPVYRYVGMPLRSRMRTSENNVFDPLTRRAAAVAHIFAVTLHKALDVTAGALALLPCLLTLGNWEWSNAAVDSALRSPELVPVILNDFRYVIAGEY